MQWYWLDEFNNPTTGYHVKRLNEKQVEAMREIPGVDPEKTERELFMYKPHCFLTSDHDIGGFFEPFKRDFSNNQLNEDLNQADYISKNIWGVGENAYFKDKYTPQEQAYFEENIPEGPLTMLIGKELFDSTDQAYFLKNSWHGAHHPKINMYPRIRKLVGKSFIIIQVPEFENLTTRITLTY